MRMCVSEGEKMKTKVLIKRVKELGFEIMRAGSHIDIMFNDFVIAGVYTDRMHVMTFYSHEKLLLTNVDKLFNLLVEYAKTPVDEREEEKKFYLRHRWMEPMYKNYLNYCMTTKNYWLDCRNEEICVQTQFTLKEIEEIKEKFNTDLGDFKEIEVKE